MRSTTSLVCHAVKPHFVNSTSKLLNSQTNPRLSNQTTCLNHLRRPVSKSQRRPLFPRYLRMVSLESKSLSGQGQTCAGINGTILRQLPLPDTSRSESVSENPAAAEMKGRRLKMRRDVWTRTLFSGSRRGECIWGRRVMYYLEEAPALCLIRAWLREAVTAAFSTSAVCAGNEGELVITTVSWINTCIHWL